MKKGVHRKKEKIVKVRYSYFFSIWSTKKHMERSIKRTGETRKKGCMIILLIIFIGFIKASFIL